MTRWPRYKLYEQNAIKSTSSRRASMAEVTNNRRASVAVGKARRGSVMEEQKGEMDAGGDGAGFEEREKRTKRRS